MFNVGVLVGHGKIHSNPGLHARQPSVAVALYTPPLLARPESRSKNVTASRLRKTQTPITAH